MEKVYLESRGALHFIGAAITKSQVIDYDWNYHRARCFEELKERRRAMKAAYRRFKESGNLPCGYQDHYGDVAEAAVWNFEIQLAAMKLASGVMPKTLIEHWKRSTGEA